MALQGFDASDPISRRLGFELSHVEAGESGVQVNLWPRAYGPTSSHQQFAE